MSRRKTSPGLTALLAVIVVLLAGAGLRAMQLAPMTAMLHYDEAYNGRDAASLLAQPRLEIFFTGNFGREGGWMYWLLPALILFGQTIFALRITAFFTAVLTLAAVYALARQVLRDRATALGACAALGMLYWAVHINHLALRANLFVLVGALALAALWGARQAERPARWVASGILTGALLYTYFPGRLWFVFTLLTVGWWVAHDRTLRRGAIHFGVATLVTAAPMLIYLVVDAAGGWGRIKGVGEFSPAAVLGNIRLWLDAWLGAGDPVALFNLPRRPILDAPSALLAGAGLVWLWRARRGPGAWLIGLGLVSVAASVFSNQAPHFLRALGVVVPVALVMGAGAGALWRWVRRVPRLAALAPVLPVVLLGWTGWQTAGDFARWLTLPETYITMERYAIEGLRVASEQTAANVPVYFSPFAADHPVPAYLSAQAAPRPLRGFNSGLCLVVPDDPVVYVSVSMYEPDFVARLAPWVTLEVLGRDAGQEPPRYTVYRTAPRAGALAGPAPDALFGGSIAARLLTPLPERVQPGEALAFSVGFRARGGLDRPYSVFAHLYGDPTPYEGGPLWAQADRSLCTAYPPEAWRADETMIETFTLSVPPDAPSGVYQVAIGVYGGPDGARLPASAGELAVDSGSDWVALAEFQVAAP